MSLTTRCVVCGALCLTSWQIMCRLCAECAKRDDNWEKVGDDDE